MSGHLDGDPPCPDPCPYFFILIGLTTRPDTPTPGGGCSLPAPRLRPTWLRRLPWGPRGDVPTLPFESSTTTGSRTPWKQGSGRSIQSGGETLLPTRFSRAPHRVKAPAPRLESLTVRSSSSLRSPGSCQPRVSGPSLFAGARDFDRPVPTHQGPERRLEPLGLPSLRSDPGSRRLLSEFVSPVVSVRRRPSRPDG